MSMAEISIGPSPKSKSTIMRDDRHERSAYDATLSKESKEDQNAAGTNTPVDEGDETIKRDHLRRPLTGGPQTRNIMSSEHNSRSQIRFASTDTPATAGEVQSSLFLLSTSRQHSHKDATLSDRSTPRIDNSTIGEQHEEFDDTALSSAAPISLLPGTGIISRESPSRFEPEQGVSRPGAHHHVAEPFPDTIEHGSGSVHANITKAQGQAEDQRSTITGPLLHPSVEAQTMGHMQASPSHQPMWGSASDSSSTRKMDQRTTMSQNNGDDNTTIRSAEDLSTNEDSLALSPLYGQHIQHVPSLPASHAATPSTVSTAPSTDGESAVMAQLDAQTMERLQLKMDEYGRIQNQNQRSASSWDRPPHHTTSDLDNAYSQALPPSYPTQQSASMGAWGNSARVASFRGGDDVMHHQNDPSSPRFGYPPVPPDSRWSPHQPQPRYADSHLPYTAQSRLNNASQYRQPHSGAPPQQPHLYNPYAAAGPQAVQARRHPALAHLSAQQQHLQQPPLPPSTPPRIAQRSAATTPRLGPNTNVVAGMSGYAMSPHRPTPPSSVHSPPSSGSNNINARAASEVLKTLLRKKACLYEPDTSRAIALVTWLVGRELAMEYGFFSRQQLQAGVHACVADKIDQNVITRTKVNRCMQIILNSCFHYIIPRPDGTEESGDSFRHIFAREIEDDDDLIGVLPAPWNDITIDHEEILDASNDELDKKGIKRPPTSGYNTPQASPRMMGLPGPVLDSPGTASHEDDGSMGKRAVLLCFNESVRCAEDVFRCHNEFIRDTAHASHLQLSSEEWLQFFGRDAALTPRLWGGIGVPVPAAGGLREADALGVLAESEQNHFRTCWCAKRYDHNYELCGFAHVEHNGGWLRRDPTKFEYADQMCAKITTVTDKRFGHQLFVINECPNGVDCKLAHSMEEIHYHPRRYKTRPCSNLLRPGGCPLGDACPDFHPVESYRFPKKAEARLVHRSGRGQQTHGGSGGHKLNVVAPSGAPMLYCSPAPQSSLERHLFMPGLQNLYRRHCSVVRSNLRQPGAPCQYSYFGDDAGLQVQRQRRTARGLPPPIVALQQQQAVPPPAP